MSSVSSLTPGIISFIIVCIQWVSEGGGAYEVSVRDGCVRGWRESSQYIHYNKVDFINV